MEQKCLLHLQISSVKHNVLTPLHPHLLGGVSHFFRGIIVILITLNRHSTEPLTPYMGKRLDVVQKKSSF